MSDDLTARTALGRAIELRRVQLGFKRKDLALAAQLSYPYISELEKGAKDPSAKAMRQIAEALHLSVADLLALGERCQTDASEHLELPPFEAASAPQVAATRDIPQRAPHQPPPVDPGPPIRNATDVSELVAAAIARYERDVLPEVVERLVAQALTRRDDLPT